MNKVNTLEKIGLYITSLWLLFLLIIFLKGDIPICFHNCEFIGFSELFRLNIIPTICLVFLLIGLFNCYSFKYKLKGTTPIQVKTNKVFNKNYEHLTFLTTYIIPLICFDLSQIRYVVVLFVLIFIIGIIYIKTDLFFANPTLALLGYHIYKIDAKSKYKEFDQIIVISRSLIKKDQEIKLKLLDDNIFYGRPVI